MPFPPDPRTGGPHPRPETQESQLARMVEGTKGLQPWRRILHALAGVAIVLSLLWVVPQRERHLGLLTGGAILLLLGDWLRLRSPWLNLLFYRAFRSLASPRELDRTASSTWYLVGIAFTVWIFPLEVAATSILVLALADPAASVVGRLRGRHPLGTGSWEGTAAFLAVATPLLVLQAGPAGGILAALVTAAAEVAPLRLDDNLVVPLVAGASLVLAGSLGL